MLLVVVCVHRSVACRLEDVVEKLAATLAVLHRVITLHCHQEGNQVWNSYRAVKCRVCTDNKGRNSEKLVPEMEIYYRFDKSRAGGVISSDLDCVVKVSRQV